MPPMSTTETKGQQNLPAEPTATQEPKPAASSAGPVKAGDRIAVRRVIGGPAIATVWGEVVKVHRAKPGAGPELDIVITTPTGHRDVLELVRPEPATGATLDGPCHFPCWARSSS